MLVEKTHRIDAPITYFVIPNYSLGEFPEALQNAIIKNSVTKETTDFLSDYSVDAILNKEILKSKVTPTPLQNSVSMKSGRIIYFSLEYGDIMFSDHYNPMHVKSESNYFKTVEINENLSLIFLSGALKF